MDRETLIRYSRQVIIPGLGTEGQERIMRSRVLVVGVGGLGCAASLYLAAAGVRRFGLVDGDRVHVSNLARQILFGDSDLGRLKVEAARDVLREKYPGISIATEARRLEPHSALPLLGDYDLVVDCTDNFPARYVINDAAFQAGIPDVYGAVYRFEGQVAVFGRSGGACYRCLVPRPPASSRAPSCADGGVVGALTGLVGAWQAAEALRIIAGLGSSLVSRLALIDLSEGWTTNIEIPRREECALCGDDPMVSTPGEGVSYEDDGGDDISIDAEVLLRERDIYSIVDIRSPRERNLFPIPNELAVVEGDGYEAALTLAEEERVVALLCMSGRASVEMARELREAGIERVYSVRGGAVALLTAMSGDTGCPVP